MLFLWGRTDDDRTQRPLPDQIDGVTIVHGVEAAAEWRRELRSADARLTSDQVEQLTTEVLVQSDKRDAQEAARYSRPISIGRIYWTAAGCAFAGIGAVLAVLKPMSPGLPWLAAVVVATGAAVGLFVRRYKQIRLVADAWLAGLAGAAALVAIGYAIA